MPPKNEGSIEPIPRLSVAKLVKIERKTKFWSSKCRKMNFLCCVVTKFDEIKFYLSFSEMHPNFDLFKRSEIRISEQNIFCNHPKKSEENAILLRSVMPNFIVFSPSLRTASLLVTDCQSEPYGLKTFINPSKCES